MSRPPTNPYHPPGADPPATDPMADDWEIVGPYLWRVRVPGGWLYKTAEGSSLTFVPNLREKQAEALGLSSAALGALPAQADTAGIIATQLSDGLGSIIWTKGDRLQLAALTEAVSRHIAGDDTLAPIPDPALARDFDRWTQGEPTGEPTGEGPQ